MTLWPPDWTLVFGIVAFALASLAAQSWRELAVLIALAAAFIFPLKWLGAALGLAAFATDTFYAEASDGRWRYGMHASPALVGAIILAAVAMILWRHARTPPDAGGKNVAD